jgi:hypothetical protein
MHKIVEVDPKLIEQNKKKYECELPEIFRLKAKPHMSIAYRAVLC